MNDRSTRVCAVVGAGAGNGASIARRFAGAGDRVAVCARTLARLIDDEREQRCISVQREPAETPDAGQRVRHRRVEITPRRGRFELSPSSFRGLDQQTRIRAPETAEQTTLGRLSDAHLVIAVVPELERHGSVPVRVEPTPSGVGWHVACATRRVQDLDRVSKAAHDFAPRFSIRPIGSGVVIEHVALLEATRCDSRCEGARDGPSESGEELHDSSKLPAPLRNGHRSGDPFVR
jgi:hypothetical protein